MSQLTIYLPAPVEREVKAGARKAKLSVSAYISELVTKRSRQKKSTQWTKEFLSVLGSAPNFPQVNDSDLLPLDEPGLEPSSKRKSRKSR